MKTLVIILPLFCFLSGVSQNINYEWVNIKLHRLPLTPLPVSGTTFSVTVLDVGSQLDRQSMENLEQQIDLPGFSRVRHHADVRMEVVIGAGSITSRELKDKPYTTEKDGVKNVYHQYHYLLSCSLPIKLRLNIHEQHLEHDLPAFYQAKYHGKNSAHENAFIEEYERDDSFRRSLFREKLSEGLIQINSLLSSYYGYSFHPEHFSVGYVKDKQNEYADLSRGMALIRELLMNADGRQDYLDEVFKAKSDEATAIFMHALSESSSDKKARVNPKVTAMIHHNLALIAFVSRQFEQANEHLEQTKKGSGGTQAEAATLLAKNADYERRYLASRNRPLLEASLVAVDTTVRPVASSEVRDSYIIGKQNDTLKVALIFPSAFEMPFGDSVWIQDRIMIDSERRPVTISPQDIRGFQYNGTYYEALWWIDDITVRPWKISHKFCRQVVRGAIPLFACHEAETDDEGYKRVITQHYYNDGGEGYKPVMFLNFNRGVSKLVAGYPQLSERVRNGEFTRDDFVHIIQTYNQYRESQKDIR